MTITQNSISTCEHEALGPVTLCRFTRGTKSKPSYSFSLVSSAAFAKARRRENPVDTIAALPSKLALTPVGLGHVKKYGPVLLEYSSHFSDIARAEDMCFTLDTEENADACAEFLGSLGPKELTKHVYSFFDDALFDIDSNKDSRPVNFPVRVDISNRDVDIAKAETHLKERKCVTAIYRDRGLSIGHDYVPPSLDVIVSLSPNVRRQIEDMVSANSPQYRFRPNDPVSAGRFAMTYALVPAPDRPAKFNALGLNALVRKAELADPGEGEEDYGY
jgi:hypothetical protein